MNPMTRMALILLVFNILETDENTVRNSQCAVDYYVQPVGKGLPGLVRIKCPVPQDQYFVESQAFCYIRKGKSDATGQVKDLILERTWNDAKKDFDIVTQDGYMASLKNGTLSLVMEETSSTVSAEYSVEVEGQTDVKFKIETSGWKKELEDGKTKSDRYNWYERPGEHGSIYLQVIMILLLVFGLISQHFEPIKSFCWRFSPPRNLAPKHEPIQDRYGELEMAGTSVQPESDGNDLTPGRHLIESPEDWDRPKIGDRA